VFKDINILLTMDIEPLSLKTIWKGPADTDASERSAAAFAEIAREAGYPVSYFIHPEMAQIQRKFLLGLEADGACLGLHIHATKFQHPLWDYEFGHYGPDDQRHMLADGKEQWAMALGRDPVYFRPGAYSANDATFAALASMGFRGGSVSLPGRVWRARYCVWSGAEFDPHRTHEAFRLVRGSMDFANIPLSVDLQTPVMLKSVPSLQTLHPMSSVETPLLLRDIIGGIKARTPDVPTLHLTANNGEPFDDSEGIWSAWLREVFAELGPACEEYGYRPVPATMETITDLVLQTDRWRAPQWTGGHDLGGGEGQRPVGEV
jgi:hypothetical protein